MKKIHYVIGPTASGKSHFAIDLAKDIGGEIVNADSLQVYQDIPTLTACPTDLHNIPHHLYQIWDCFTVGNFEMWVQEALPIINQVKNPILVGGTGLYAKLLYQGISPIPDIDPVIRQKVRQMEQDELLSVVKNPTLTDKHRLMRQAEVLLSTGKSMEEWHQYPPKKYIEADFEFHLIDLPRKILYEKIERRFHQMVQTGAIDELKILLSKNPSQTGGVFQALGVKELTAYLNKEISLEEAVQKAIISTRHYAKRQQTFFKTQFD